MMKARFVIGLAPGIVLALATAGAHAQLDGTLFTQPEEREYLDYLREEFLRNSAEEGFDIEETAIPEIPPGVEASEPSGPSELSFGGIMTRRDGSRSLWLNGRLLEESELPEGISLLNGESTASLRIAFEGNIYVLRPGQTVDLETGSVVENYQRPTAAPTGGEVSPAPAASASAATASTPTTAEVADAAAATSEPEPPMADDTLGDVDSAVAELSDREAEALAAALARRRAGTEAAIDVEAERDENT